MAAMPPTLRPTPRPDPATDRATDRAADRATDHASVIRAPAVDPPAGAAPGPFDADRARAETPCCAEVVHLNHAGCSLAPHVPAADVHRALAVQRINVSVSEPSSTLLDALRRELPPLVRASVHYTTTEDELDTVAAAVAAA
jgi:hypothetical protein